MQIAIAIKGNPQILSLFQQLFCFFRQDLSCYTHAIEDISNFVTEQSRSNYSIARIFDLYANNQHFNWNVFRQRLLITVLCASASYIATTAAMRMTVPEANPSLYISMALALTFPFYIIIGIPIYLEIINRIWG